METQVASDAGAYPAGPPPSGAIRPPASGEFSGRPAPANGASPGSEPRARARRRLELLLRQLVATGSFREVRDDAGVSLLAAAVAAAGSGAELDTVLARLRGLGLPAAAGVPFRVLASALPPWGRIPPAGSEDGGDVTVAGALLRLVKLGDPGEATRCFAAAVDDAVARFNAGSLGAAVTALGLASLVARTADVDWHEAVVVRARAPLALDAGRMRGYAESPVAHALLKDVLEFFPSLMPQGLLESLAAEKRREARRLLVQLLEVHGGPARDEALARLRETLAQPRGAVDWFFQRNLVVVLRRIPRAGTAPSEAELDALCRLSEPSQPAPLVKEALASLGLVKGPRVEQVLLARVTHLAAFLSKERLPEEAAAELRQLLDHASSALAAQGTPAALRAVADHALKGTSVHGDPLARLAALSGHDLSRDPVLVERLLDALRAALPVKVLGFCSPAAEASSGKLLAALSGTPAPAVRKALVDVAHRFDGLALGRAAEQALKALDAPRRAPEPAGPVPASGSLDQYGLPGLLLALQQSRATGMLFLFATDGLPAATLAVGEGSLHGCGAGRRQGLDAAFQLLERPQAGTFVFSRLAALPAEERSLVPPVDLVALVLEGTRRHAELSAARALVPDGLRLAPTGVRPSAPDGEADRPLLAAVWRRAAAGESALACESALPTDGYRVRRLLVHWLTEGALAPAA